MKIFVDFDDVIFNTKKFIVDLVKVFKRAGISEEIFRRYYHSDQAYDPADHIKRIKRSREINFDSQKLKNNLNKLLADTSKYVFNDVESFLNRILKEDLYLLSYGDEKFQKLKVINSGIAGYFKKIIISDKAKSSAINNLIRQKEIGQKEKTYFLDDKVSHLEDVKEKYQFIATILVKRKDGRHENTGNKYCDYEVKNLSKALKIIGA